VKHISLIACVSAARESFISYMIMLQDSASVREQLMIHDIHFRTDLVLKSNRKPYINTEIFLDYIQTVFLPDLAELRMLDAFTTEISVLLMDNCSSYVTSDVIGLLTQARVRVITFASHATQIFQVLDLTLFGILKRYPRYELPFEDQTATVKFILKIYPNFKKITVEPNI
jgi:hypothetical protein